MPPRRYTGKDMSELKGRRVLVTGATGLVGSNLVARLIDEGAKVRATLHRRDAVVADSQIEYVRVDLTREKDCRRIVEGQEFVFMCAASTSGAATIAKTPMLHVTPNVVMNARMLQASYDAGVERFLWFASTTGYPVSGDRPIREEEMFDGEPFDKYFFVGWTKRFTEVLCLMYGEKLSPSMATIVLRPTNIYGPQDDFEPATSHVTAALVRKVIERLDPLEVWGTGNDVRDIIHVDDIVDATILAIRKCDHGYNAYNIGYGEAWSVKQILETLLELDDYSNATVVFNTSKPTMIPIRLVDVSKARRELGFSARISPREGLRRTLEFYRSMIAPA